MKGLKEKQTSKEAFLLFAEEDLLIQEHRRTQKIQVQQTQLFSFD